MADKHDKMAEILKSKGREEREKHVLSGDDYGGFIHAKAYLVWAIRSMSFSSFGRRVALLQV